MMMLGCHSSLHERLVRLWTRCLAYACIARISTLQNLDCIQSRRMRVASLSLPTFEVQSKVQYVTGPDLASRSLTALLSAFSLATICWIAWVWGTPGKYFANGNTLLLPFLIASGFVGLGVGWSAYGRGRLLIMLLSMACFCYWAFVPTGWWSRSTHLY